MKKQRFTQLVYVLFAFTFAVACYYFVKSKGLEKQLLSQNTEQQNKVDVEKVNTEELTQIDALILDGDDYSTALRAYQEKYDGHKSLEEPELQLRISLTKKLLQLKARPEQDSAQIAQLELLDSLQLAMEANPNELEKLDSINFALEKTKAQLARMQRQLLQKTSGEYLTFTNSKGSKMHYVGQVKNGKANGFGVAILNTGSRYIGEWKDNQRHGEGSFYWHDGQFYQGQYENDQRSGKGTYHWPNGEKFVGLWKADERTGEGAFFGKKGDVVASGLWEHDELIVANKP